MPGPTAEIVRRAVAEQFAALPAAELLGRYAAQRDAEAFAGLVWQFGPLVYGVCRRVLGPAADADDAFQAVFLALARQASSLRDAAALPAWLHRLIRRAEWTTERTRRRVRTRTVLWKGRPKTMVFAFAGWSGARARNVHEQARRQRRLYRQRFGIETSYRQKNQAKAGTTSRDPVYRLLLEGVAYLLRQVWVVLTEEVARRRGLRPGDWVGALTMPILLDWLAHELERLHPENRSIPLGPEG